MEVIFFVRLGPPIWWALAQHSYLFFSEKAIGVKAQSVILIRAARKIRAWIIVLHAPESLWVHSGVNGLATM